MNVNYHEYKTINLITDFFWVYFIIFSCTRSVSLIYEYYTFQSDVLIRNVVIISSLSKAHSSFEFSSIIRCIVYGQWYMCISIDSNNFKATTLINHMICQTSSHNIFNFPNDNKLCKIKWKKK